MPADLADQLQNLPNLHGPGALFAFSGLDGPTNAPAGFAATCLRERYSLLFHTPTRRILSIRLPTLDNPLLLTSDVLLAETQTEPLFLAFAAWHTLLGVAPAHTHLRLTLEDGTPAQAQGHFIVSADPQAKDVLVLLHNRNLFALSFGRSFEEAARRAEAGLIADFDQALQDRLALYAALPPLPTPGRDRLLKKCISVLKASILAPEGILRQPWCVADRTGRPNIGQRDSVFHALAIGSLNPRLAWNLLKSVLDTQRADGLIGDPSSPAPPPLLAWSIWKTHQHLKDPAILQYAFPRLEDHLGWLATHRDRNRNGLLEEATDASPLDAIELSTLFAHDARHLHKIALALGNASAAKYWLDRSAYTAQQIHNHLWDPHARRYADRHADGRFAPAGLAGLLPLLLDDLPETRLAQLARDIADSPCPRPDWSTLLILALRRHRRPTEAQCLKETTLNQLQQSYERTGVLFAPDLPNTPTSRDHHLTAAATALLLLEPNP